MQSNYKRLGDYIHKVDKRNRDSKVEKLLGISMTKEFRVSTSNINGTDMSVYKVVNKDQFSCDFMSVIRVHKFPVVLKIDEEPILVSPAYIVFEVNDAEILNPYYLMMWFRRSEFDRYADFKCDSAIRGGFDWDALCDCLVPIPSLEKQLEIVKEYDVIQNRIKLNNQLIAKLEETVQTIYKQWYVDFEFPNENGLPYKSNGGEIVKKELGGIPKGWSIKSLSSICTITSSKRIFEKEYQKIGVPFYRAGEIRQKKEGIPLKDLLFISETRYKEIVNKYGQPIDGDILITAVGSLLGDSYLVQPEKFYFKDGNVIWIKNFQLLNINVLIFSYLQSSFFEDFLNEIKIGSGQSAITIKSLADKTMIIPCQNICNKYFSIANSIYKSIALYNKQKTVLHNVRNLILSKMTKVEQEKDFV